MDGAKHTKGPWAVGQKGIVGEDGEALFVTGGDGTVWWKNEADAHLLAAAPDLLAAAKKAVEDAVADDLDGWFADLKVAIAKAEGE